MAKKLTFDKSKKKSIKETSITAPKETFDIEKMEAQVKEQQPKAKRPGRPAKNKDYTSLRLERGNVRRVNALRAALNLDSQDDLIEHALDHLEKTLDEEQKTTFDLYMQLANRGNNTNITRV